MGAGNPFSAALEAMGSPVGGLITDLIGGLFYNRDMDDFQRNQVDPLNRAAQDELAALGPTPNVNSISENITNAALRGSEALNPQNVQGRFNQYLGGVVPGYEKLADKARFLVGSQSNQAVTDVNRRFDQLGASAQMGLRARGIGGSTVAPSLAYANERNRGDELRRVNDDRINQLLGVERDFGAAVPDAQAQIGEFGFGAQDNAILNRLGFLRDFGQMAVDTPLRVSGLRTGYYGEPTLIAPAPYQPIQQQRQFKP